MNWRKKFVDMTLLDFAMLDCMLELEDMLPNWDIENDDCLGEE